MLVELALEEQDHYDHPRQSARQLEASTRPAPRGFAGESRIFLARDHSGAALGLAWCLLFDPGNGLEAEIAELYVRPAARGRGVAHQLCAAAMALFRSRRVTFACVWTRPDNEAALAAYRAAGFAPTEQLVLTWLPLPGR
jgi:ribosomal protein S18 acetylase RimI-like enzyme